MKWFYKTVKSFTETNCGLLSYHPMPSSGENVTVSGQTSLPILTQTLEPYAKMWVQNMFVCAEDLANWVKGGRELAKWRRRQGMQSWGNRMECLLFCPETSCGQGIKQCKSDKWWNPSLRALGHTEECKCYLKQGAGAGCRRALTSGWCDLSFVQKECSGPQAWLGWISAPTLAVLVAMVGCRPVSGGAVAIVQGVAAEFPTLGP